MRLKQRGISSDDFMGWGATDKPYKMTSGGAEVQSTRLIKT